MAYTSTIKSLDELMTKQLARYVKVKNAPTKPVSVTLFEYSLKTVTLMTVYFGKE